MALRLRRGTDLERIGVVFAVGELVYSTDTKRLFIGDGVTAGGIPVSDLISDMSPQLGASLDLNTYDIVGFGNINVNGDITASGTLTVPNIITDVQGSIFGDDSSPLVDGANNKIILDNNSITDLSDVDTTGVQVGDVLKWDGANWLASTDDDTTLNIINDLSDVDTTGVQVGDVLKWDGANWLASTDNDTTLNIINDLSDVDTIGVQVGDVLKWDGANWVANPDEGQLELADLTDVLVGGLQVGDILSWDGVNWTPTAGPGDILETDIQGSVYGLDSSIIVDAATGSFIGNFTGAVTGDINSLNVNATNLYVTSIYDQPTFYSDTVGFDNIATFVKETEVDDTVNRANITLVRKSTTLDLSSSIEPNATILFATDDTNGFTYKGVIGVHNDLMTFAVNSTGNFSDNNQIFLVDTGYFGIGTKTPTEKLQVEGNTKISGFVQFGSYTTAERDDLTTTNTPQYATNWGMVIYNTDTNKFQGWQNTGGTTPEWVDLS